MAFGTSSDAELKAEMIKNMLEIGALMGIDIHFVSVPPKTFWQKLRFWN